jgi:hypothetical protein
MRHISGIFWAVLEAKSSIRNTKFQLMSKSVDHFQQICMSLCGSVHEAYYRKDLKL